MASVKEVGDFPYAGQSEETSDGKREPSNIAMILQDRGGKYGDFTYNAQTTQGCMDILMNASNAQALNNNHKEAIHMIVHKLSRIVNGNADLHDSWDDIAGYAKLVSDRIPK